ncbi:hypothetical protein [Avibacterium paragallinarum]|uniref:Uncharacterized protein n=1 Tax=Avibacterium paragallinarum TaxID=728 RepID=A0ABU7QHR6_AVIPA|nr:hypothetical protein [Avibacterium paragallinarum]QZP14816.1 hypothetical protein K5O18_08255 [Avibacterium paragallinarum]WAL56749.1 hypothetical protein OY678_12675 [Avibacterium paragallinarum]WAM59261.1 hypothetical protein OW731_12325 [Avibacterium paragallinarum]
MKKRTLIAQNKQNIEITPLGKRLITACPKGQKARFIAVQIWRIDYGIY